MLFILIYPDICTFENPRINPLSLCLKHYSSSVIMREGVDANIVKCKYGTTPSSVKKEEVASVHLIKVPKTQNTFLRECRVKREIT